MLVSMLRRAFVLVLLTGLAASLGAAARGQEDGGAIVGLRVEGVVDPFLASYIEGGIEDAEREGAAAVLLTIDTPGGLDSSMRKITQAILNTRVPVIGFVSPEGARAASAGTFILLACPVAAMAPATNVGAAHPVGVSGAIESQKAENDAAEYIRGLAERRGRNADWAEQAVRESRSAAASEALELGVIDLVVADTPALIEAIDGRTVEVAGGEEVVLRLAGAQIDERRLGLLAGLLHALLDPNIAFILFYLGLIALYFEFTNPGLTVPGVLGVIMLIGAFIAFGVLPVQLAGVLLLIASAVFFVIEVASPGIGVALAGGITTLVLGGLFLFDGSVPNARVSPLVIAPVAVFTALFFGVVVRAVIRAHRQPAASSVARLIGLEGVVHKPLDPDGVVLVASEEWSATSPERNLPRGARIRVIAVDDLQLRLTVEPVQERTPASPDVPEGSVT